MTKALILAAGQGTRLRPMTNDRPKCLVTLMGISLLERQVSVLNEAGIIDIHVATGYKADQIKQLGFATSINKDFDKTNMVESLFCAMDFIKECKEDLIIGYGDIIYQKENLDLVLKTNDEITLMIDKNWKDLWSARIENPLDDAETLVIDEYGYVQELGKKPQNYEKIHGQYTGLIKIRKDKLIDLIAFYQCLDRGASYDGKDFKNMYMTSFLQLLINSGWKVKAANVENGWLEVDSVDDLVKYERMFKSGNLKKFINLN